MQADQQQQQNAIKTSTILTAVVYTITNKKENTWNKERKNEGEQLYTRIEIIRANNPTNKVWIIDKGTMIQI